MCLKGLLSTLPAIKTIKCCSHKAPWEGRGYSSGPGSLYLPAMPPYRQLRC